MPVNEAAGAPAVDLRQFDDCYAKASAVAEDYYSDIPDGTYNAVIEEARLSTTSTGRPIVFWTLRIEGPQAMNRVVQKNQVVTEKTIPWLKEDLEKCGLMLTKFSQLPSRIGEMTGRGILFEKKTKEGRGNIYFRWNSRRQTEVLDDDLPF